MEPPNEPPSRQDNSPVDDSESLLRHFPNEPDRFDFGNRTPRLSIFLPTPKDTEGLSLNREGFISAKELLQTANSENVRRNGGVVAVLTETVRQNGMSVIPLPANTPGHVIIPEMNRLDYDRKLLDGTKPGKNRIKMLADILARMASVRIDAVPKPQMPQ